MQKKYFLLVLLISISTTLFSQDNADENDSSGKKNAVPKDRNMFGHGITFRSTFIPADHPGLANKKLEPINPQPAVYVLPPPPGDTN